MLSTAGASSAASTGGVSTAGASSAASTGGASIAGASSAASTGEASTGEVSISTTSSFLKLDVGSANNLDLGTPAGCQGKIDVLFGISTMPQIEVIQPQLVAAFPKFVDTIATTFENFDVHINESEDFATRPLIVSTATSVAKLCFARAPTAFGESVSWSISCTRSKSRVSKS